MSNNTVNDQRLRLHKAALSELNKRTALLKNIADSNWTWLNPSGARPRVVALIKELVGYHKVLDRQMIHSTPSDIDAAKTVIFQALIASAETVKEQGSLTSLEWHSRLQLFIESIDSIPGFKYNDIPAYEESGIQAQPEEKAPSIFVTIWSYLKHIVSSFFEMFTPKSKPQESEPVLPITNSTPPVIPYVAFVKAAAQQDPKRQSYGSDISSESTHDRASTAKLW